MTAFTANLATPAAGQRRAVRQPIPYLTIFLLLFAAVVTGALSYFSGYTLLGPIIFAPIYISLCWFQPQVALWIMLFLVAFPYNISGGETVHTAPAEITLCLAFPVFWFRSISLRRSRVTNPILIPVGIYFFVCTASTLVHWTGRDAIVSILQMVLYLLVAVKFFSSYVDRRELMYGIWGLITACSLVTILLLTSRSEAALNVHKNATGTFLSYVVIILAEMYLASRAGSRHRKWVTAFLFFNTGGLVMSTSRGAWLGTLAGLGVLLLARRQFKTFARGILLMIPAVVLVWLIMPQEQREYALDFGTQNRNIGSRLATIDFFKNQFLQNPTLGMGVGLRKEADSTNIIMSTLAETGVLGLAAFAMIHLVFFWVVVKNINQASRAHPDFSFLALAPALVLCLFTHGLADHYWSRTQLPVWAFVGAAFAVRAAQKRARLQMAAHQLAVLQLR